MAFQNGAKPSFSKSWSFFPLGEECSWALLLPAGSDALRGVCPNHQENLIEEDNRGLRSGLKDNACRMLLAALAKTTCCGFVSSSLRPGIECRVGAPGAQAVSPGAGELDLPVQGVAAPGEHWSLVAMCLDAPCTSLIPPRATFFLCGKLRPSNACLL